MPAVRRSVAPVLVVGLLLGSASAALADGTPGVPPNFTMAWDASGDAVGENIYNWNQFGSLNQVPGSATTWNYTGSLVGGAGTWALEWDCTFDADPFVIANIVVTNNSAVNQTFSLLMTLPIAPAVPNPLISGSLAGTLTDLNGNGATVSAVGGDSIYTSYIDSVVEQRLMLAPFSTSAGAFDSVGVGPQSFGTPAPILGSQNADTSIGIRLFFELTPGDSASFTAIFEVVPAPGSIALLALAGLFGTRRRRN